jgi:hypothetical protein
MERLEKLAALGALGVAGGAMAAWLGFVWFTRPVATGGMEPVTHFAMIAASFVVFAMVAAAHLWLGLQLRRGPESITG